MMKKKCGTKKDGKSGGKKMKMKKMY